MPIIEFLWYALMVFLWVAYLFVLFFIFTDLFRDHAMNGFVKAIWILVCFFPLGALIYLIVRGRGMGERAQAAQASAMAAQQAFIRQAAGATGPADQIAQAKVLLDNGAITAAEFEAIKAKALTPSN